MKIIHKKFVDGINERIQNASDHITAGNAQNMQEYGRRCGYLAGLKDSLESFEEVWKQYINNPDEAD